MSEPLAPRRAFGYQISKPFKILVEEYQFSVPMGPELNITAIDFLSRSGSGVGGRACGAFFNPQTTSGEPKSKNPIAESNILNPRSGTAALCLGGDFSPKHRAGVPLGMVPVGGGWAWVSETHQNKFFCKQVMSGSSETGRLNTGQPYHLQVVRLPGVGT